MTEDTYFSQADALKEKLCRTAYLYLGSESAAVDTVDEAIYKGYLSRKKLRQENYFATWLTRILINVCLDELRRQKRECAAEPPERSEAPDYDALPLKEAILRLNDDLRSVIVLRYFSGYTLAETACILGLQPGTVSSRQRKALALLKLELSDEEVEP